MMAGDLIATRTLACYSYVKPCSFPATRIPAAIDEADDASALGAS
jgi:hypothetical protein